MLIAVSNCFQKNKFENFEKKILNFFNSILLRLQGRSVSAKHLIIPRITIITLVTMITRGQCGQVVKVGRLSPGSKLTSSIIFCPLETICCIKILRYTKYKITCYSSGSSLSSRSLGPIFFELVNFEREKRERERERESVCKY